MHEIKTFFSVPFEFIPTGKLAAHDLFINSSAIKTREKFVRIFPKGEFLAESDIATFKKKYRQLYIPETQRPLYLNSLCESSGKDTEQKAVVLKDSAIHYLDKIFSREHSSETLTQTISECRDVVSNMVETLRDLSIENLQELIGKLSFHDFYTYDHSINVSMYSILIYQAYKPEASKEEIVEAGLGGLLHDIGKIKIDTRIINSSGDLSDNDFAEIKKHPGYGFQYIMDSNMSLPKNVNRDVISRVVHEHHENFDGSGYPQKIAGRDIHVMARIVAVADFFDAVTTKRSYHEPLSTEDALALMGKSAGKKLDPILYQLFAELSKHQLNTETELELPPDFDPCQPHQKLEMILSDGNVVFDEQDEGYGKIKIVANKNDLDDWEDNQVVQSEHITILEKEKRGKKIKKAG